MQSLCLLPTTRLDTNSQNTNRDEQVPTLIPHTYVNSSGVKQQRRDTGGEPSAPGVFTLSSQNRPRAGDSHGVLSTVPKREAGAAAVCRWALCGWARTVGSVLNSC